MPQKAPDQGTQSAPPPLPYEEISNGLNADEPSAKDSISSSWDKKCPEDWQTRHWNLGMIFYSDIGKKFQDLDWEARLEIHAKNVPRLMRQSFCCTTANVQPEEGYFLLGKQALEAVSDTNTWTNCRVFQLTDLAESPQWIARLLVFADKMPLLSNFRLEDLSVDKMRGTCAMNWDSNWIYNYDVFHPEIGFNAIYNDMPLSGWWPWPRNKE